MWARIWCVGVMVVCVDGFTLNDHRLVAVSSDDRRITRQLESCPVTIPNSVGIRGHQEPGVFGNGQLSVGLWPNGVITFSETGHGFRTRDGGLGTKVGWRRAVKGVLRVAGWRIDGPSAPLRAWIPSDDAQIGRQSTYLVFPTEGCWEVTGSVDHVTLTFVTYVVKIGNGPRAFSAEW
jgi:hypothetical protein